MSEMGSSASLGLDIATLFAANAVVLFITALAFLSVWLKNRESYWLAWIAANLVLTAGLVILTVFGTVEKGFWVELANALLVLGFSLRFLAARRFVGRTVSWPVTVMPFAAISVMFALPDLFTYGTAYTLLNLTLAGQALLVAATFWQVRGEGLPSVFGLTLAYGLMGTSFAVRAGQGMVFMSEFTSYLPQDLVLEIHLLVAMVFTVASGAFALSIAHERVATDLRGVALRDALTGLGNRRAFETRMRAERAARGGAGLGVILIDVDHFKRVNDRYGHAAGDEALRQAAEALGGAVRQSDFVARIGGEEFAVVLAHATPLEANAVAERARAAVEAREIRTASATFKLTISAGVYFDAEGADDFDALMRKADASLYLAKAAGRNRIGSAGPLAQAAGA